MIEGGARFELEIFLFLEAKNAVAGEIVDADLTEAFEEIVELEIEVEIEGEGLGLDLD